ncbi:hypothetical protein [Homoserinibacter sp. GY 40078]|uniref:hypothetical protein n=1 Tax=Homoserinibacter sp. GY 40078 TaxID=2603275 RepID=UPI0011CA659B|nr:hypothetical protein [Homoserinibacter sp. GY 40078]TXK19789.1 hypothetical protein FVQ89_07995 [Homoserinibacter sp. GY 40078]
MQIAHHPSVRRLRLVSLALVDSHGHVTQFSGSIANMTPKRRLKHLLNDDRGDVPGWVLITLMTAALVLLIWALAGPALSEIFQNAIDKVSGI